MRRHLHRYGDLVQEQADRARFRTGTRYSILMGPVAYAMGAVLAWVSTPAAFICYAAIAAYFIRPREPRTRR
jgi:demethoxyubiquinone hydroxylase (CLK1/Coq7/Cat5 family)